MSEATDQTNPPISPANTESGTPSPETVEQKAERLLRHVGKAEISAFQEGSAVAIRDGSVVKVEEYGDEGREYEENDLFDRSPAKTSRKKVIVGFGEYADVQTSSVLINTQGAVESILSQHGQAVYYDQGGLIMPPRNELFSLVSQREGKLIVQGGGQIHLDSQGSRPNISSYKFVFNDGTAGKEFLAWLELNPREALYQMLHESLDKYNRDGGVVSHGVNRRRLPLLLHTRGFDIDKQTIKNLDSGGTITIKY